jgi:hypothetical protein
MCFPCGNNGQQETDFFFGFLTLGSVLLFKCQFCLKKGNQKQCSTTASP